MKKQVLKAITKLSLVLMVALITSAASAQGQSLGIKLRANIPFDFIIGNKTLPAGQYTVARAVASSGDSFLVFSSLDGHSSAFLLTNPVEAREPKKTGILVFNRYGDQYFLSQVWASGSSVGRELFKSRSERNLAANSSAGKMAKNTGAVETVTITGGLQ